VGVTVLKTLKSAVRISSVAFGHPYIFSYLIELPQSNLLKLPETNAKLDIFYNIKSNHETTTIHGLPTSKKESNFPPNQNSMHYFTSSFCYYL